MDEDKDAVMEEDPKSTDPDDLSAYKLDEYDDESTGAGMYHPPI